MRKMFMAYLLLFSQVAWVAENATQQPTEDQGSEEAALDTGVTREEAAAGESDDLVSDNEGNEQEVEEERTVEWTLYSHRADFSGLGRFLSSRYLERHNQEKVR